MDQLLQLQSQFPEFWSKTLSEGTGLQSLLLAYSYVYGDALQKWQEVKNELSPFTIDPWHTEYYKIIDLQRNRITPSDPELTDPNYAYYEVPLNSFYALNISKSIDFVNTIRDYNFYYDKILNKSLLQIQVIDLDPQDKYLYIKELWIDNQNVVKTYGSLFNLPVYYNPDDWEIRQDETMYGYQITDGMMYAKYLKNVKAQIINMIRCSVMGGTVDALESLISVAAGNPYVEKDGTIISWDNWNTWIEFTDGNIVKYSCKPKKRFQQQNAKILAYEAITECPVMLYSYVTNPARFAQALLCEWSDILFQLLRLQNGEVPNALYYDMANIFFDSSSLISFDFGVTPKAYNSEEVYPNYENPTQIELHSFTEWSSSTLHPLIYQFFKNVMIAEIPNYNNYRPETPNNYYNNYGAIDEVWLKLILEYFRPLHSKYVVVGFSRGGEVA
jgi:hypothetical protein